MHHKVVITIVYMKGCNRKRKRIENSEVYNEFKIKMAFQICSKNMYNLVNVIYKLGPSSGNNQLKSSSNIQFIIIITY